MGPEGTSLSIIGPYCETGVKDILDKVFGSAGSLPDEAREPLATLIRAGQEDASFREQLVNLLSLDAFNRSSAVNTFLDQLRLRQAPKRLESAIAMLLDNDIAERTLKILGEAGNAGDK